MRQRPSEKRREAGWETEEMMRNRQGCLLQEAKVRENGERRELGKGLHLTWPAWDGLQGEGMG